MANKAAQLHFERVAEANERILEQRLARYDRMSPYERLALGLTLHREQLALKRAMLGQEPKKSRPEPFSIKRLRVRSANKL